MDILQIEQLIKETQNKISALETNKAQILKNVFPAFVGKLQAETIEKALVPLRTELERLNVEKNVLLKKQAEEEQRKKEDAEAEAKRRATTEKIIESISQPTTTPTAKNTATGAKTEENKNETPKTEETKTGLIVGISFGVLILIFIVVYFIRKKKKTK